MNSARWQKFSKGREPNIKRFDIGTLRTDPWTGAIIVGNLIEGQNLPPPSGAAAAIVFGGTFGRRSSFHVSRSQTGDQCLPMILRLSPDPRKA
jgi:hypothetical protein